MNVLTDLQVGWLSGIVEGEGCLHRSKKRHGAGSQTVIKVAMVDEDTVRRCHELTGLGRMLGPYTRPDARANHQPIWIWTVARRPEVKQLLSLIFPHLSDRRRARAMELLA